MSSVIKTENVVIFVEEDGILDTTIKNIEERMTRDKVDALVLGQFPCHDLGFIDPVSGECSVPNANAFAVSRKSYEEVGPVDDYLKSARAADYAYRLKKHRKKIGLATDITVPVRCHPSITQSWIDSVLYQYKYSSSKKKREWIISVFSHIFQYDSSLGNYSRRELLLELPRIIKSIIVLEGRTRQVEPNPGKDFFLLGNIRGNYTTGHPIIAEKPRVSLILRTHERPEVLRLTLNNLRRLDYSNYEIILVEDGSPCSQKMVKEEFFDLPIKYYSTGKPVGRAAAANIGFRMAIGEWVNLIDDDDFFFPEHLSVGIDVAISSGKDIVFLQAVALETISKENPYTFDIKKMHHMDVPRIDPFIMSTECKTSDNGVLFKKELLPKIGWMREDLKAHEDWSLWLRLMSIGSWCRVPYATCLFVNPFEDSKKIARDHNYRE